VLVAGDEGGKLMTPSALWTHREKRRRLTTMKKTL
jgi:hypothetical protein